MLTAMRRLPLFPLPVVLLPGASLPLHVFEPRYREMMAHCLEGDRRFGLVYHDPDRAGPFLNEPGPVGCVAEIVRFEPLGDGRSRLLARGRERFRIEDGIESAAPYYEGLVEEYEDEPEDEQAVAARSEESLELFHRVLACLSDSPEPDPPLRDEEPLSFQIAQWIRIDPTWQQALLQLRSERERLDRVDPLLRTILETEED
ncbi:MAG TPA: LON peptidase substrate-binding domain-containing protein [Longimicrobiaceae bacterium]|nr:LON peptidase substrate-binding domain-containing protein [Longimicrobiaceae bacterium]